MLVAESSSGQDLAFLSCETLVIRFRGQTARPAQSS